MGWSVIEIVNGNVIGLTLFRQVESADKHAAKLVSDNLPKWSYEQALEFFSAGGDTLNEDTYSVQIVEAIVGAE